MVSALSRMKEGAIVAAQELHTKAIRGKHYFIDKIFWMSYIECQCGSVCG